MVHLLFRCKDVYNQLMQMSIIKKTTSSLGKIEQS